MDCPRMNKAIGTKDFLIICNAMEDCEKDCDRYYKCDTIALADDTLKELEMETEIMKQILSRLNEDVRCMLTDEVNEVLGDIYDRDEITEKQYVELDKKFRKMQFIVTLKEEN